MLSIVMPNAAVMSVVMLNAIMLSSTQYGVKCPYLDIMLSVVLLSALSMTLCILILSMSVRKVVLIC